MSPQYIIAIDLGTTGQKCVIYDLQGNSIAEEYREIETIYPGPGAAEIRSDDFFKLTCINIKQCLEKSRINKKDIAVIAIDSLMGGIIGIDKKFNAVTYYDTAMDSRAADESNYLIKNFGDLVLEYNGAYSIWGHKILYWKKKNEWESIYKFVHPAAFVGAKLTGLSGGEAFIDQSFLSFSALSDLRSSTWSEELCKKLEIDIDRLPRIIKSTDIIGTTTSEIKEITGLNEGTPVCAGCGDVVAGYVGSGVLNSGEVADISGTANILAVNLEDFVVHKHFANMKSPINDSYYLLVSHVLGGRTLKWFTDEFYTELREKIEKDGSSVYEYLDREAEKVSPGSHGLVSIDDLQGRFFPPDMRVRGLFIGHTWSHKKIYFYRSILEAIAYDYYLGIDILRKLVQDLKFKEINAIGSGANSRIWLQIKADVLQVSFKTRYRSDLSTLGAAVIGAHSVGLIKDINSFINSVLKTKSVIKPKKGEDQKYKKYIDLYIDAVQNLNSYYAKLS
jgi:xylulokinase